MKVLRIDLEAGKLSLGMKPSYLEGEDDAEENGGPVGKKAKLPDIDGEAADMDEEEAEDEEDLMGEDDENDDEEEGEDEDDEDEAMVGEDVDDVSEIEEEEKDDDDNDDDDDEGPRDAPGETSCSIRYVDF